MGQSEHCAKTIGASKTFLERPDSPKALMQIKSTCIPDMPSCPEIARGTE